MRPGGSPGDGRPRRPPASPGDRPQGPRHAAVSPKTIHRRRFLVGLAGAGGAAGAALAATLASGSGGPPKAPAKPKKPAEHPAVAADQLPSGVVARRARWLIEENARPGTLDWVVTGTQTPHAIEGFASQVSAVAGDHVALYVNTGAPAFHVEAYRMGYYQGLGGRLVHRSHSVAAKAQPQPTFTAGINMIECPWTANLTLKIDSSWPQGDYLLKLVADGTGQQYPPQQYVPLCVRDDASTATFCLQNSVTTWQAYNRWGGYSLYYGNTPSGGADFANRSRIVSFDRPYPQNWAQGSADFFGNEFPVLYQMESLGLDMTYWTDVDLHVRPQLLAKRGCLLSLGHDEYWSRPMRSGAQSALTRGTNLAFLGANACYRQIRFQKSPVGPYRQEICYKNAQEDPLYGVDNALVTAPSWQSPPTNDPESKLIGDMYQSVGADADMVIVDASSWIFDGCNLADGQHLSLVVQGEYDRYVPSYPGPKNLDVLAHSPITNQGSANWSDLTYYTRKGGGGVVASGSAAFVNKLSNTTAFPTNVVPAAIPGVTDILLRLMENVYGKLGNGPASATQPSTGNWTSVYTGASASAGSAQATPAA